MSLNPALQHDLSRALRTHRYERAPGNRVYVPGARVFVGGAFAHTLNGADRRVIANDMCKEGLIDVMKVVFAQGSQRTAFYMAPFSGTTTPDPDTLTAANFASTQTEFTAYSQSARPTWTPGTITTPQADNSGSPGLITISTADSTIWGFALLTASAKSATTGVLYCCAKDSAARDNLRAGDKLNTEYDIVATDA